MRSKRKNIQLRKVDKSNYRRILLTEVLPYEVPILLTNEGFYSNFNEDNSSKLINAILQSDKETSPLNYKIIKSQSSFRTLHLIHPSVQNDFIEFYKTYSDLICGLTSRSEFTLRAPAHIANWYYESSSILRDNALRDEGTEAYPTDESSAEYKYASSYFVYKKYPFLYKFYDSYEFHRLEKNIKH
jgi:hypothetical protein